MNKIKIIDEKRTKVNELEVLTTLVKKEHRKMDTKENEIYTRLKGEVVELNNKIDVINADDKSVNSINKKNNRNNMKENFSLLKTIRDLSENKPLNEETRKMFELGKESLRSVGVTPASGNVISYDVLSGMEERTDPVLSKTSTQGAEVIAEDKFPLLVGLKAKTVLGQAGARFLTGLKNDISIPTYDSTTVYWADEVDSATGGTGAFSEVTLAPKRLSCKMSISKSFLAQDSIQAEKDLMNEMVNAVLVKVEATALSEGAATTKQPAGIFAGASYAGSLSGATSWAKLVGMKSDVDTNNALTGSLSYVTTPALAGTFETTAKDSGSGLFCMENGKIAGYPVYSTTNVLSGKAIFGNWGDYVIGNWGNALDIVVDPYTQAGNNMVVVTINSYWDFKVIRDASFNLNRLS